MACKKHIFLIFSLNERTLQLNCHFGSHIVKKKLHVFAALIRKKPVQTLQYFQKYMVATTKFVSNAALIERKFIKRPRRTKKKNAALMLTFFILKTVAFEINLLKLN
jgi:hypothetical protein